MRLGVKSSVLTALGVIAVSCGYLSARAGSDPGFPDGLDAVEAAPASHRVLFENALVRVLEVTMPPNGQSEPMHHHRWPSFFLDWDTGGKSPHIRYHQPGGKVRDVPSEDNPPQPGRWEIHWMKPEPLHAIETVDYQPQPGDLPSVRVEIKVAR
jgi:hypothetical protein